MDKVDSPLHVDFHNSLSQESDNVERFKKAFLNHLEMQLPDYFEEKSSLFEEGYRDEIKHLNKSMRKKKFKVSNCKSRSESSNDNHHHHKRKSESPDKVSDVSFNDGKNKG
jgi:hypothetical protein